MGRGRGEFSLGGGDGGRGSRMDGKEERDEREGRSTEIRLTTLTFPPPPQQALECDYVSANLHKWIDLIFGYKQKGEEALVNHNVFHHFFYEGAVDIDKISDTMQRNAAISFIHNFGQMPKQVRPD